MEIKNNFDTGEYQFKEQIEKLFGVGDLPNIHTTWRSDYELLSGHGCGFRGDQSTIYHKTFYDEAEKKTNFYNIYEQFVESEIKPLFDEPIIYQKIPTFRVHLPNNTGVSEYHRDRDFNHSIHEMNVFLPMTQAKDTNTIWRESKEGKGDLSPMQAEYGDYYIWDGANLLHGNKLNDTNKTRISVDFRVMKASRYEETDAVSISIATPMIIGGYWTR